ncbi:anthranilate synthase component I [Picosynechococcus sp. PCC 73109]|uniref:anthranilate synthase component I n=1 Tax=Picosynechococcus sp. PCC 73109 TaxID=374982 RepID=UPI0007457C81|nr:anthranilate synthase component I [Picosynechococcus sp. PCC 73109]AMA08842.1 anthranilate synthase [Picosynechococcus sp. PCC 73109]
MWHWRSQPLAQRTGAEIFTRLYGQAKIATLLESPYPTPKDYPQLSRYSICAGAPRAKQLFTPALGEITACLKQLLATKIDPPAAIAHLPFTGGYLGWLGYDFAWEIETLPYENSDPLPFPVAYWYQPDSFAVLDHHQQVLWLAAATVADLDRLTTQLSQPCASSDLDQSQVSSEAPSLEFLSDRQAYTDAVRQAKQYIQAGDIFQTNLSLRFRTQTSHSSWAIYQHLQQINPSPFASYWRSPWGEMISCSPERLIQKQGRFAQTRPIGGTRPRGQTPSEDQALGEELLRNTKERAEHTMLVDLERNDLGRACTWGSVAVDEQFVLERYSHVIHLVSNVVGELAADKDAVDLIRGMFPGGTITGCPKVRCMEIIEALEPVRRSLFYGSCGYLDQRGNLDLNILIRTLLYVPNAQGPATVYGQVGAGIVADSDPEQEWAESLQKAKAQRQALNC